MSPRVARAVGGALVGIMVFASGSACSGGKADRSGSTPAPTAFPPQPAAGDCAATDAGGVPGVGETGPAATGAAPTVPPGVDVGPTGSGLGSGNPYTVVGARPIPGPDMPATTLGATPSQHVVAEPPNPNVGTPANLAPGETVAPLVPTTPPPPLAPTSTSSPPTTGLMTRSSQPDCVLAPGDP